MKRFHGKYRISSARLPDHDYAAPGWYFVTICTKDRHPFFGEGVGGVMRRSHLGQQAHDCWAAIPDHFAYARLADFVVMPNHVHGLVGLLPRNRARPSGKNDDDAPVETGHGPSLRGQRRRSPIRNQTMADITPAPGSLGVIINQYKGAVTRWARRRGRADFGWQPRFYDHVVRNRRAFRRISRYIRANPARWHHDRNHPDPR